MDKRQQTVDIVVACNNFRNGKLDDAALIQKVCSYYDLIKYEELNQADLQFLKKIASMAGIPHYFDHLDNFQNGLELKDYSLGTLSAALYESTLCTDYDDKNDKYLKVHKYQKQILSRYVVGQQNRFFLSASTSFGKTHLVYEIIRKMEYKNIVLLFPTIALLTENLERVYNNSAYNIYNKHTLSDVSEIDLTGNNIFIYTPERFLSFMEKQKNRVCFDFVFIDEVYKIDNEYIIDEDEKRENERDVSYRIAAYYTVLGKADILLAGPYIEKCSHSFDRFLNDNQIIKLDFNKYEIVNKTYTDIKDTKRVIIDHKLEIEFSDEEKSKEQRFSKLVNFICMDNNENCIAYCSAPHQAEKYAKKLSPLITYEDTIKDYKDFVNHIKNRYGEDWVIAKCLQNGVGVHHGLVPKYIQKEIIRFFNCGVIKALTSTTTITEGVNTSAKNLIVLHNKKGFKPLKRFDAKNIAGRAGRFDKHYSGRVIVLKNSFQQDIEKNVESINHKNYDLNSVKNEIDLFYTNDEFLTKEEKDNREDILSEQQKREIPDYIMDMFKVVGKRDKIEIYDRIRILDSIKKDHLKLLIQYINNPSGVSVNWERLQTVLDIIHPITTDALSELIQRRTHNDTGQHSILVPMLSNYLSKGFKGLVQFELDRGEAIDNATRKVAKFVYSTAKYQIVKYLGVFNVMYKYICSVEKNIDFEDIKGIDRLLTKLEYNALTDIGRRVSDYGVPDSILRYYEEDRNPDVQRNFDDFEKIVFNRVESIVEHK